MCATASLTHLQTLYYHTYNPMHYSSLSAMCATASLTHLQTIYYHTLPYHPIPCVVQFSFSNVCNRVFALLEGE